MKAAVPGRLVRSNGARLPFPRPAAGGELPDALEAELRPALLGALFLPGDGGYDRGRGGFNLVRDHRPAAVVEAVGAADVMAAVAFATRHGLSVGVVNTGHTATTSTVGGILIGTRRMRGVRVDPVARTARVEAGTRWDQVVHEAAPFGLAPLSGSSPSVGAVGYTLGGGLGLLGRAFGYAADHVRGVDVVTAHGMSRQVSPSQYADLFWAIRGGKGNFGVVTSMEIDLFEVRRLYGGGLYFRGSLAPEVFHTYRRWVRTVPDEMSSSIALLRFPLRQEVPEARRGQFVVHVRIAYLGSAEEGEKLVRPLRRAGVVLRDTLTDMPYSAAGSIHDDPTEPFAFHERSGCLRALEEDTVDALLRAAGPDTTCPLQLVELRHLGGALAREPSVPNAVGNRDAAFHLYASGAVTDGHHADHVVDQLAPWLTGGVCLNFLGTRDADPDRVRSAFPPETYRGLGAVKRAYDPENIFRINHNVPPALGGDAGAGGRSHGVDHAPRSRWIV